MSKGLRAVVGAIVGVPLGLAIAFGGSCQPAPQVVDAATASLQNHGFEVRNSWVTTFGDTTHEVQVGAQCIGYVRDYRVGAVLEKVKVLVYQYYPVTQEYRYLTTVAANSVSKDYRDLLPCY